MLQQFFLMQTVLGPEIRICGYFANLVQQTWINLCTLLYRTSSQVDCEVNSMRYGFISSAPILNLVGLKLIVSIESAVTLLG